MKTSHKSLDNLEEYLKNKPMESQMILVTFDDSTWFFSQKQYQLNVWSFFDILNMLKVIIEDTRRGSIGHTFNDNFAYWDV